MFNDARIGAAVETMICAIDVPPVPLLDIQRKTLQAQRAPRNRPRSFGLAIATAAAIAIAVAAFPFVSEGFARTIESQIAAILHWQPPPPPPGSVKSAMRSQTVTLAAAQSRVPFRIVPPGGLPNDVTSEEIVTTPTGIYSKRTHSWRVGPPAVDFIYHRAGGRTFDVMADRFDPRTGPPPKYIFDADTLTTRDGHLKMAKHENVVWRNGDQLMSVVEGNGISAREIEAIRVAMGGVVIPGAPPGVHGTSVKQYRIPAP